MKNTIYNGPYYVIIPLFTSFRINPNILLRTLLSKALKILGVQILLRGIICD
jgi:hypothetical protein